MRLFFSLDLPPELHAAVEDAQANFERAAGVRLTDPTQAHVTLKFLGETDPDRVDEIREAAESALASADVSPFEVAVGGFGVFPSMDYISVVWAGFTDGSDELARLHEALERETTALGFDPESHEFTPHVTLARMDDARGKSLVQDAVRDGDGVALGSFTADEIRLKESVLTPEGPSYETLERFPL